MAEAKHFGLSWLGDGATVKNNLFMNAILHVTHHPVAFCGIFYCTGHMEGGKRNNSNFFSDFMKVVMDELDPRKK